MQFAAGKGSPRHIHKPPHCSTYVGKGADIRAGQRTEHSLTAPFGCSSALFWLMTVSTLPAAQEEQFGAQGGMTLLKMTIIFWPLKQRISSGIFY